MSDRSPSHLHALCRAHGLPLADDASTDPDELFDRLQEKGVSSAEGRRLQLARALGAASRARDAAEVEALGARLSDAIDECRRLRRRTDGLLAALDGGALLGDAHGRVVGANASACAMTGLSAEALHEAALAPLLERLDAAEDVAVDRRPMPDGSSQLVLVSRREDDGHDEAFERLAVLTHKINNPLTSLLGRTQILQAQRRDDPVLAKALGVIGESAQRIADLVREVAQIARRGTLDGSRLIDPDR